MITTVFRRGVSSKQQWENGYIQTAQRQHSNSFPASETSLVSRRHREPPWQDSASRLFKGLAQFLILHPSQAPPKDRGGSSEGSEGDGTLGPKRKIGFLLEHTQRHGTAACCSPLRPFLVRPGAGSRPASTHPQKQTRFLPMHSLSSSASNQIGLAGPPEAKARRAAVAACGRYGPTAPFAFLAIPTCRQK